MTVIINNCGSNLNIEKVPNLNAHNEGKETVNKKRNK